MDKRKTANIPVIGLLAVFLERTLGERLLPFKGVCKKRLLLGTCKQF